MSGTTVSGDWRFLLPWGHLCCKTKTAVVVWLCLWWMVGTTPVVTALYSLCEGEGARTRASWMDFKHSYVVIDQQRCEE